MDMVNLIPFFIFEKCSKFFFKKVPKEQTNNLEIDFEKQLSKYKNGDIVHHVPSYTYNRADET